MKSLIVFFVGITLMCCSNSDESINPTCYKDENRKVIATFENAKGKIIGPNSQTCSKLFTLEDKSGKYTLTFSPCNLTEEFKEDGLDVVFSGYLFETFEVENICAPPFELTKIKVE
ncbi:hypothetical protein [Hwangdonia seohaensis]|uniref:Lipoprotein n=1 Tax=Hwangdonia seohaensis TaxID=1240727 RepID=A0ABW3R7F3_9FLAO|nr:hypothetical protein [Hwangdonia seohaensis]